MKGQPGKQLLKACFIAVVLMLVFAPGIRAAVVTTTADSGAGSLRAAIVGATPGTTITFNPALSGQTILLTSGQLTIGESLDIDASALPGGITIDGNGLVTSNRIFEIQSGRTVHLDGLTLTNGLAAGASGGAILVGYGATLAINNSTITGNSATQLGGGIHNAEGFLLLENSTIMRNSADYGGGIHSACDSLLLTSYTTITNTTLFGNTAITTGGGIYNYNGLVNLTHCTIAGNTAPGGEGSGVASFGDNATQTRVQNCIVSGNTGSDVDFVYSHENNSFESIDYNLIGTGNALEAFNQRGDQTGRKPKLAPLGSYGGPTPTMPPLPGSSAIDAVRTTPLATDQRGFDRVVGESADIGAVETQPTVVLNNSDSGNGSLRQTLERISPYFTATFSTALDGATILLTSGQIPLDRSLDIDASALPNGITIDGNGPVTSNRIFEVESDSTVLIDGLTLTNGLAAGSWPDGSGGAILVNPDAFLTFNNSTLAGNSARYGGGICNHSGILAVNTASLGGNSAIDNGGGIYTYNGILTINSTTLAGNSAINTGGGIYSNAGGGGSTSRTTITNSTFFGNTAFAGGGIYNYNELTELNHCTLVGNTAAYGEGSGVGSFGDSVTLTRVQDCIIADNTSSDVDLVGSTATNSFTSLGHNLLGSGDALAAFNLSGDQIGATADLAPLGCYGGPTQTLPPKPGSMAIDAGGTTSLTVDQRGFDRVVGAAADIGAAETQPTVVLNNNDSGPGSLRRILERISPFFTATFTNTLDGATILLTSGQMSIDRSLTIDASALPGGIAIDGNGPVSSNRIFEIESGTTALFDSLTLTNGLVSGSSFPTEAGGAIYINPGASLALNNSILSGNTAYHGGSIFSYGTLSLNNTTLAGNSARSFGGGIYNYHGSFVISNTTFVGNSAEDAGGIFNRQAALAVKNSTFASNSATVAAGGGIDNYYGKLVVKHTTFAGNSAATFGGGIYSDTDSNFTTSYTTITNCTFFDNTTDDKGGGIFNDQGLTKLVHCTIEGNTAPGGEGSGLASGGNSNTRTSVQNSIIADNTGSDVDLVLFIVNNSYTSFGHNLIGTGNALAAFNQAGDQTGAIANLAPLGNYGGPTQTMPPLPGSPAIDAGGTTTLASDQRGYARPAGPADIGAVEIQGTGDENAILTAAWATDTDGDGNAFGVEYALGTDWLVPDAANDANPVAYVGAGKGGVSFGFNSGATHAAWVVKRSLNLVKDTFTVIYRKNGPADINPETAIPLTIIQFPGRISIRDYSDPQPTNAFYLFEAELIP